MCIRVATLMAHTPAMTATRAKRSRPVITELLDGFDHSGLGHGIVNLGASATATPKPSEPKRTSVSPLASTNVPLHASSSPRKCWSVRRIEKEPGAVTQITRNYCEMGYTVLT